MRRCPNCGQRSQERFTVECPNGPLEAEGVLPAAVHGHPPVLEFVTSHGFTPVKPDVEQGDAMREATDVAVVSTDPVRVRITYSHEGKMLRLVVDGDLTVQEVDKNW